MIEMAIGLLLLMLILSGLLTFGEIIPKSMRLQSKARCQSGYEAQAATSGTVTGRPIPHLDEVLQEPEVAPVEPQVTFTAATERPLESRLIQQTFSVKLDPLAKQFYWDFEGKTSFRGKEECYMPLMTIPEFSARGALP